jgi:hypothetical protein
MVIIDFLFQIFMLMVITDHWTTLGHVAMSNNVIPQVFQSQRNLPRRPKPETYGWNHIL